MTNKTENPKSELNETEALLHLKKIEIRFQLAKILVITAVALVAAWSIYIGIRQDNDRTRDQINCVVDGFLLPPERIPDAVHKCRK